MSDAPRLVPGARLGRYEIQELLGRGGMGVVFKARDPAIGRMVAIKGLRLDVIAGSEYVGEARARFAREAQAIGQLSHPHIVTLYDTQQEGDTAYLVMEFVAGRSLDLLLRAGHVFSLEQVCAIGIQVCDALDHAHSRQVVHRDIKPDNILLQDNGHVKVTDFGVAYLAMSALTKPGESIGTPSYMAPEQIMGKTVDGRADLFALGAVLYEICATQKAFPGETMSTVIYRILHTEPAPLQEVNPVFPAVLDATIRKALAKDPDARYASAREFMEALARTAAVMASPAARAIPTGPTTARATTAAAAPPAGPSRFRWVALGGIAAAGLGIASVLWNAPDPPPSPEPAARAAVPALPAPATQEPPAAPAVTGTPAALRVAFARDIKGILPVDEGETFYRDDGKVVLWVRWANVRGKHRVVTRWFDAEGEFVYTPARPDTFESPADLWTTWTTLPLRPGMMKAPGQWRAEIYLDKKPVLTAHVTVLDQPRPRPAK